MERERPRPTEALLPEALPVNFAQLPEQVKAAENWVVWKYAHVDDELKKPPFNPATGRLANIRSPDTWGSFHDAQTAYATGQFAGVGIVLTPSLGIVGVDIDHCIQGTHIHPGAKRLISLLDSYTEVSPSGTGIRILLAGKLPGLRRRRGSIELYDDMRYLTLTGHRRADSPQAIRPRQKELSEVYHRLFSAVNSKQKKENTGGGVGEHPKSYAQVSRPDEVVLQKALRAKNGETFLRYYTGDSSLWEGAGAKHASQSEADFTLVLLLLYWTNNDTIQTDRLFRQSGLMREKWDRRIKGSETYGERVIHDAIRKGKH